MGLIWKDKELIAQINAACEVACKEGAEKVAESARTLAPVLTGDLRMRIDVRKSKFKNGGYMVMAQGPGNYSRFYASFVELGTHNTEAQPFLRPALRKNKGWISQNFENKLK